MECQVFFGKMVTALNEYFATILFAESSLAGTIRRFSIGSSNGVDSSVRADSSSGANSCDSNENELEPESS